LGSLVCYIFIDLYIYIIIILIRLSAAARPGEAYSYTHNWPHDPLILNSPTPAVILWSALSVLVLWLGLMLTLYVYGQFENDQDDDGTLEMRQPLTTQDLYGKCCCFRRKYNVRWIF